jgi:hypothetical protein
MCGSAVLARMLMLLLKVALRRLRQQNPHQCQQQRQQLRKCH